MSDMRREIERIAREHDLIVRGTDFVDEEVIAACTEVSRLAYREAAAMQCNYCADSDPDTSAEPKFFPYGYVPNYGEVDNTFLHETKWGGLYPCEAANIHLALRLGEEGK
jgi:hypothetical protein